MIEIRVNGHGFAERRTAHYVQVHLSDRDEAVFFVGDEVESSDVVLDDPDAVGALADALRRIERRMREATAKRGEAGR